MHSPNPNSNPTPKSNSSSNPTLIANHRVKRVQWGIFNRWLKLLERESLDCTTGLVDDIIRRKRKHERFSQYLIAQNFQKVIYLNR
jgi:hypothetical protein